jgi:hypothetical protein
LIGKLRQLIVDPTLRRWLAARALGRVSAPPRRMPHRPPYLGDGPIPAAAPGPARMQERRFPAPATPISLPLPGETATLAPGGVGSLFARTYADTETLLAVHRFAWVPILGAAADPAWVIALWHAWRKRFPAPDESWAWHPYTAAERAVNLLGFFRAHGWPEPAAETRAFLATHAPAIAARLEYFGERGTGNHLANDGRGLFALGLELGMPAYADMGAKILIEENRRIFSPSGVLREGSSHYHLLYARNYTEAWLWARRHGHGAAPELEAAAAKSLAVVPRLCLKGGLPLIGDISPDCPPDHLAALLPGGPSDVGWGSLLDEEDRAAFRSLKAGTAPAEPARLAADGWLRADVGDWSGLWHTAPGGWSAIPGHGHQDVGSFEIHWKNVPLFIDTGRGAYGETGAAAIYRSARVHNGLTLDDADPYPPNKPYYDESFRRREGRAAPVSHVDANGIALVFGGYGRMGAPAVRRHWTFSPDGFEIADAVEGRGSRVVTRRLHTPWPCEVAAESAVIRSPAGVFRVRADGAEPQIAPTTRWTAYGVGHPAQCIGFSTRARLPWSGRLRIERA